MSKDRKIRKKNFFEKKNMENVTNFKIKTMRIVRLLPDYYFAIKIYLNSYACGTSGGNKQKKF